MTALTNRSALEQMSRAELIELLDLYAEQVVLMDSLWARCCALSQGARFALEMDRQVWALYARKEAQRLLALDAVAPGEPIEQAARLMLLSPMFGPFGGQARPDGTGWIVETTNCRPQIALAAAGKEELPCKEVGAGYTAAFLAELNPELRFECVFCPPDPHPQGVWCRWRIRLEE
jgi:hypothetical protein